MGDSIEGVKKLLYLNKNESGQECGLPPTYVVPSEIATRCDLSVGGRKLYGLIDGKIIDNNMIESGTLILRSSPTFDD